MKYNHKIDQTEDILELQKEVRAFIKLAQYKNAHKYLTTILKKYPSSYYIASMLATLNAEDAWVLPEKEKNKAFNEAAKKLRRLLYSVKGASPRLRSRNINEYYWFSQQHKKQYDLGVKRVALGEISGLYSQGVGAANYAYKLSLEGKKAIALRWAKKSQLAWEEYFENVGSDYHDPWYWYALSLGLQGKEKEMDIALIRSAKLSRKNLKTDSALRKLRRMIQETLSW
jgi:hypothetical protein